MNLRRVRRFEWLTLLPVMGPFPHTSHRCAIVLSALVVADVSSAGIAEHWTLF